MNRLEVGTKYPALWSLEPEPGESAVPGLFWVDGENGEARAAAHRSFDDRTHPFLVDRAPQIPRLYGDVMGRRVTLIDCTFEGSQGSHAHSMTDSQYSARRALIGDVWPAVGSEPTFDQVRVVFWDQDVWANLPPIDHQVFLGGPSTFTSPKIEPQILNTSMAELGLHDNFEFWSTDEQGFVLNPGSQFRLELPEAQSYDELRTNWLMPLQFLILWATSRRTGIRSLFVRNSTWEPIWRDEPEWMEIRVQHATRPHKPVRGVTLLHRRDDFPTDYNFDQFINAVRSNRYAVDQYAGVRAGLSGGYLTKFVAVAQALEALDRVAHPDKEKPDQVTWAERTAEFLKGQGARSDIRSSVKHAILKSHWSSLQGRLSRMNKQTGKVLDAITQDENWPQMVADARNIVAHGLESSETFQRDETAIFVACQICLILFDLRFLVLIGFTADNASTLVTRRAWHSLTALNIREHYPTLVELAGRER